MAPVPMLMSAYFWLWHTSAPDSPTRPLDRLSASSFVTRTSMPSARHMSSFWPVARMAEPISVPKNQ